MILCVYLTNLPVILSSSCFIGYISVRRDVSDSLVLLSFVALTGLTMDCCWTCCSNKKKKKLILVCASYVETGLRGFTYLSFAAFVLLLTDNLASLQIPCNTKPIIPDSEESV